MFLANEIAIQSADCWCEEIYTLLTAAKRQRPTAEEYSKWTYPRNLQWPQIQLHHPVYSGPLATAMEGNAHPARWKVLLCFAIIYFVWGSTFLAIRIGVHEVPPFLLAGIRFLIAGLILYLWMLIKGEPSPTAREWRSVLVLAILIFMIDYGLLFWAEQRVASGIAAVLMATIPAFMALSEILFLGTQTLTFRLLSALLIGLGGVGVLTIPSLNFAGAPIDTAGAIALLVASVSWSISSAFARKLPLPPSKVMSSGAQMLLGGVLLLIPSAIRGEFGKFHPAEVSSSAWVALLYLIVAGSIIAFTAYVWLIHHQSPTRVGTYAYVNPLVAVLLGYFAGGESIGSRTLLGTALVLISVFVITLPGARKPLHETASESA